MCVCVHAYVLVKYIHIPQCIIILTSTIPFDPPHSLKTCIYLFVYVCTCSLIWTHSYTRSHTLQFHYLYLYSLSLCHVHLKPIQYQYHSGYTISDISNCLQDLHRTHALANTHQQQAIRQKYLSEKWVKVTLTACTVLYCIVFICTHILCIIMLFYSLLSGSIELQVYPHQRRYHSNTNHTHQLTDSSYLIDYYYYYYCWVGSFYCS